MTFFKDKMGKDLSTDETVKKISFRIYNIFLDFELFLLRIIGYVPFHIVRTFFYRLCGIKIGKGSTIHMWAGFYQPENIAIGDDTILGDHAFLDGRARIDIGNHVDIASQVLIYNSQHDIDSEDFHGISKPVRIEDYTFIGPRAIILPGVTIGKGAVVAAGAVVTDDVEPFTVVGGVPAKEIRKRLNTDPHYKLGRARLFQ